MRDTYYNCCAISLSIQRHVANTFMSDSYCLDSLVFYITRTKESTNFSVNNDTSHVTARNTPQSASLLIIWDKDSSLRKRVCGQTFPQGAQISLSAIDLVLDMGSQEVEARNLNSPTMSFCHKSHSITKSP